MSKALFISDKKFLSSVINGGVQLCTLEYLTYISLTGFDIETFPVQAKISLLNRVKIKIGIDTYAHYDIETYLQSLLQIIEDSVVKVIFFNQVSLAMWAETLKKYIAKDIKLIALSHGNESTDYFHETFRNGRAGKIKTWKLGRLMLKEARLFSSSLDGMVVMNENEAALNTWLGAGRVLYLPRLLEQNFLTWSPIDFTAGFVGTLDHLPNRLGLQCVADQLTIKGYTGKLALIGGPPEIGINFERKYPFITYLGPVGDRQLAEEVGKWSLFLNPVFWFARGASTKLSMGLNWGLPCLTTEAGKRGYVLADERIVTLGNDAGLFADGILLAMHDQDYLRSLKIASEKNVVNFDKSAWVSQLKLFLE